MFYILLDFELAEKNVLKELGIFFDENIQDTHFALQKSTNPKSNQFGVQENYTELCGAVDVRITLTFPAFFPVMLRVKILQNEQEKALFLATYWVKR